MNESGLLPLGRAVLVQHYLPERKESIIVMPDSVESRSMMVEQRAVVVAVGPEAWVEEKSPRARPGDKVMISKMAGWMTRGTKNGEIYRIVNDRDVFAAIIEEEGND